MYIDNPKFSNPQCESCYLTFGKIDTTGSRSANRYTKPKAEISTEEIEDIKDHHQGCKEIDHTTKEKSNRVSAKGQRDKGNEHETKVQEKHKMKHSPMSKLKKPTIFSATPMNYNRGSFVSNTSPKNGS